jgi:hypothetical protein
MYDFYSEYFDSLGNCTDIVGFLLQKAEDHGLESHRAEKHIDNVLFLEKCYLLRRGFGGMEKCDR